MELVNIHPSLSAFSNGGPVLAISASPAYEYDKVAQKSNTDKIIGTRILVVFPNNEYDKLTVTVSGPDTLSARFANGEKDIPVDFENFTASIYSMRGGDGKYRVGVSAKATRVIDRTGFIDFGDNEKP